MNEKEKRETILIVDDTEFNRELLSAILSEDYQILEAENGVQAVKLMELHREEISLVLLDIMMPEMDGFEFLEYMNLRGWIESIPVIMLSSENTSDFLERAYAWRVTDFISRPFEANIVRRRAANTIALYTKQRRLAEQVERQLKKREKDNQLMISILSHLVEFRNGESGRHVLHIGIITRLLLQRVNWRMDDILSEEEIERICMASALHDIGKLSIPSEILNKDGRLTEKEFAVMKTHPVVGSQMLQDLMEKFDDPLLRSAYEICRWHHERYDGSGYPDGLSGKEIPLSAQVVSLADVYDALTSERCYKEAMSHEMAMEMILSGKCGAFSPLMLACLQDVEHELQRLIANS